MTSPPHKPAVNGVGWCIERYTHAAGWRACTGCISHGAAVTALSKKLKYQREGQVAVDAMTDTWDRLYAVMAEVQAGTRPMPTDYADVEPLLPALVWPV